jgi:hypothetical protein
LMGSRVADLQQAVLLRVLRIHFLADGC